MVFLFQGLEFSSSKVASYANGVASITVPPETAYVEVMFQLRNTTTETIQLRITRRPCQKAIRHEIQPGESRKLKVAMGEHTQRPVYVNEAKLLLTSN